ncbi:MAG: (2Fe-2S)-binding protein [Negativicutes bacterium]|nr:(2Fe-2S)-binding protein [Negativicutes bacterium]
MRLDFLLNGVAVSTEIAATDLLTDVLRDKLRVTSVKKGCETGDCGACSVLINGALFKSCVTLAATIAGKSVATVEGLMANGELSAIQKKLAENHGTQCGFCTPGMVLAIKALLDENPKPTEEEIRRGLAGNLCRCTGYQKIIDTVKILTA